MGLLAWRLLLVLVSGATIAAQIASGARFPAVGVAVEEPAGGWCAMFPAHGDPLTAGAPVAVVFPELTESVMWTGRIAAALSDACGTAFPQSRWEGYAAYRLDLRSSASPAAARKSIGLAVVTSASWRRAAGGALRADLDGDGLPEEARRCAADEGEHFTIWTIHADGRAERRAHEYFDWGGFTERTCAAGDDGR